MNDAPERGGARDFIRRIVAADVAAGRDGGRVVTRFPPEPNGHLHIGHAKSVCLNFGIAAEHAGGICYLRFDDTNPAKEDLAYVESIEEDVRWLGFDWQGHLTHASDYFAELYEFARHLVRAGKAYVDDQSAEQVRAGRGTLTEPGRESPARERGVDENLDLLERMRAGEFPDGSRVLRARIDMAAPNLNLRDPVLYRIMRRAHPLTGEAWCIYPTYDFAHGQCDALEGVTHSLCTLEFEDHRPLYDWLLENLPVPSRPRQYEFSRLNLTYTVMSKRMLNELVSGGHVEGWDDPRMPTLKGLRRRGFTPAAIRELCARIGVTKKDSVVEMEVLENCVREDLERRAPRRMGVLRPLRLVVENYPQDGSEEFEVPNHPSDPAMGTRLLPFSRVVWIERDDFRVEPPSKYHRLAPGREVRLRYAWLVTCTGWDTDPRTGEVTEVRCRLDADSRGGNAPDGRKVRGTIHWVSQAHARAAQVRLYDRLFTVPAPGADAGGRAFTEFLNPDSVEVIHDARVEPALAAAAPEERIQLERLGYFCVDRAGDARHGPVLNRTVTLRDTWGKLERRGG